jgi:hypothetical protein
MSIAVSVLTTSRVARNNGGVARQESAPQSAPNHIRGTLWASLNTKQV